MALAIADRLRSAASIPDKNGLNILIYGPPGIGKTTAAASAQDSDLGRDVLFIAFDPGMRSIADRADIMVLEDPDWAELSDVHTYLESGEHTFRTVVIDSLTEAYRAAMGRVVENQRKSSSAAVAGKPGQKDFGDANELMIRMVQAYTALSRSHGMNIIFTALQREETDDFNRRVIRPDLTPGAGRSITGIVDILAYMAMDEKGQRVFHMHNTVTFQGKVRQPKTGVVIPPVLEDPSIGKMLDLLRGTSTSTSVIEEREIA